MSTSADHLADPELLASEWALDDLLRDATVEELLDEAAQRAEGFASAYAGRLAELDAEGLRTAMQELEELKGSAIE